MSASPRLDESPLRSLPNLGPASERMLHAAGIRTPGDLRALGAVPAFLAVRRAGRKPSLNLLWALEGALSGRDWKAVAQHERTALLMQLDDSAAGGMRPEI
ncbi:MAG: TfoX/Sxy family protein [Acidovorax sp.]|uniref:TfoX/Sxy family protein n=1 Tax=Acidovorax sp. TaxID=1872122 RepID=UPI0025B8EE72|nr:TfoX/Sxy family protein [Acidovorax sp.]MCE1190767.1 TfoX/Sxy family protein [Acidovorax sp.]